MDSIVDKKICLVLNNAWQPIQIKTVKEAVCSLYDYSFQALDIEYEFNSSGVDFDSPTNMTPLFWEDWIKLEVRSIDYRIRASKFSFRAPTVLIAKGYSGMPIKRLRPTTEGIRKRDKGVCQYTGKKLKKSEGSVDHVLPKSRGGKESWGNLVYCEKKLNTVKSNQTPEEAGLKLIKNPSEPSAKPACSLIDNALHRDWKHFLM